MRRSAWPPAALVLLLGACVPDVDISHDTALSGHLTARTFRVRPGVVVSAGSDLIVDSRGPAIVEGTIRGSVASGASVEIRVSSGDCVVEGRIEGGSGADGRLPGADGRPGGGVRLRADRGEVRVRGVLEGGDGGEGAGRLEQGRGDLRVASGAGGAGGDVALAGRTVELDAPASGGDGGAGGASFAESFVLAPGAPNVVDYGESRAAEEEDDFVDQPPLPTGSATAVSRSGGNGGSIRALATGGEGSLVLAPGVSLRAGSGGETARASARGGLTASTTLEKPGAGGDVSLRGKGLPAAAAGRELAAGQGGDAGLLGAISGFALARDRAVVTAAGGGAPGQVFLDGKAVAAGEGGDSGNVLAQTARDAMYDFGEAGGAGRPGKPAAAHAP